MLTYVLLWFPMLLIAIGNGALRDLGYKQKMGEKAAHQLSTITLLLLFAVYIGWAMHRFTPGSVQQAAFVGLLWLLMTVLLEAGMGRMQGKKGHQLLADYNIMQGRLWTLIPLWVAIAPLLFYRIFS